MEDTEETAFWIPLLECTRCGSLQFPGCEKHGLMSTTIERSAHIGCHYCPLNTSSFGPCPICDLRKRKPKLVLMGEVEVDALMEAGRKFIDTQSSDEDDLIETFYISCESCKAFAFLFTKDKYNVNNFVGNVLGMPVCRITSKTQSLKDYEQQLVHYDHQCSDVSVQPTRILVSEIENFLQAVDQFPPVSCQLNTYDINEGTIFYDVLLWTCQECKVISFPSCPCHGFAKTILARKESLCPQILKPCAHCGNPKFTEEVIVLSKEEIENLITACSVSVHQDSIQALYLVCKECKTAAFPQDTDSGFLLYDPNRRSSSRITKPKMDVSIYSNFPHCDPHCPKSIACFHAHIPVGFADPFIPEMTEDQMQEMKATFEKADIDKSGTLCQSELKTVLASNLGRTPTKKEVDSLMSLMDQDKSGSITLDEYLEAMEQWMRNRKRTFGKNILRHTDPVRPEERTVTITSTNSPLSPTVKGSESTSSKVSKQSAEPLSPQWVATSGGRIPANAVDGGLDSRSRKLYVARAKAYRGIHPGKAGSQLGGAEISYGGLTRAFNYFEVLVLPQGLTAQWHPMTDGEDIPQNALVAGYDGDRSLLLYVVRASPYGKPHELHIGKWGKHLIYACIPIGSEEVGFHDFEILVINKSAGLSQKPAPSTPKTLTRTISTSAAKVGSPSPVKRSDSNAASSPKPAKWAESPKPQESPAPSTPKTLTRTISTSAATVSSPTFAKVGSPSPVKRSDSNPASSPKPAKWAEPPKPQEESPAVPSPVSSTSKPPSQLSINTVIQLKKRTPFLMFISKHHMSLVVVCFYYGWWSDITCHFDQFVQDYPEVYFVKVNLEQAPKLVRKKNITVPADTSKPFYHFYLDQKKLVELTNVSDGEVIKQWIHKLQPQKELKQDIEKAPPALLRKDSLQVVEQSLQGLDEDDEENADWRKLTRNQINELMHNRDARDFQVVKNIHDQLSHLFGIHTNNPRASSSKILAAYPEMLVLNWPGARIKGELYQKNFDADEEREKSGIEATSDLVNVLPRLSPFYELHEEKKTLSQLYGKIMESGSPILRDEHHDLPFQFMNSKFVRYQQTGSFYFESTVNPSIESVFSEPKGDEPPGTFVEVFVDKQLDNSIFASLNFQVGHTAQQMYSYQTFSKPMESIHFEPFRARNIVMSFRFQKLAIRRPWMNFDVLFDRSWSVPNVQPGEWSLGTLTPSNSNNPWPLTPRYLVVASDINIKITGSMNVERELFRTKENLGVGPFTIKGNFGRELFYGSCDVQSTINIVGRDIEISIAGPQLIGWICALMPKTPPKAFS